MAKKDEYMEEAYSTLLELSADDIKRLEYEAREKALRDYNSQMSSSFQMGEKQGIEISRKVFRLHAQGKLPEEIARICSMGEEEVKEILFG